MTDVYRHAASVLVLRPSDKVPAGYQLLLVHKPRKNDNWQLPQGGAEKGESTIQTALRELMEEAGIQTCEVIGQSQKVYSYNFPPSYRRFRPDNVCGQRIEYVFALVPTDITVCVDQHEIDDFLWISIDELESYVQRKEYLSLVNELFEEAMKLLKSNVQ